MMNIILKDYDNITLEELFENKREIEREYRYTIYYDWSSENSCNVYLMDLNFPNTKFIVGGYNYTEEDDFREFLKNTIYDAVSIFLENINA